MKQVHCVCIPIRTECFRLEMEDPFFLQLPLTSKALKLEGHILANARIKGYASAFHCKKSKFGVPGTSWITYTAVSLSYGRVNTGSKIV